MAGRLAGKVALITGAARAQGRAHAVRMAQEGADIVAFDICRPIEGRARIPAATPEDLALTSRLVEACDRRVLAVQGDVRNLDDLERAARAAVTELGGLDIAVANAGTSGGSTLAQDITEEDWATTLDVNLTGVWHTAKAVLPRMIAAGRGGSLILIASVTGVRVSANLADYSSAKAGVMALGRVLAIENGRHGIRVNVLAPGNVDTPLMMNEGVFKLFRPDLASPGAADITSTLLQMAPLASDQHPILEAEDLANAALWLASDEARFVSGTVIPVDMGRSA